MNFFTEMTLRIKIFEIFVLILVSENNCYISVIVIIIFNHQVPFFFLIYKSYI